MTNICIVGDILVDYTLMCSTEDKMRHGGIMHAARGAFAIDANYSLYYFAPKYLDASIFEFARRHNGKSTKIGNVSGAPSVILIKEAKETSHQGYELLLREETLYEYDLTPLEEAVQNPDFSDFLVFTGGYELSLVNTAFRRSNTRVHIDISNDVTDVESLASLGRKYKTIFLSTSSDIFLKTCKADVGNLLELLRPYTETLVFKENRGGSRYFDFRNEPLLIPAQSKPVVHSVGVGDNYDVAFIWASKEYCSRDALYFASWVAADYACTTYVDDYKKAVQRTIKLGITELSTLGGVSVPWEKRKNVNIYIAAPDFSYVNTTPVRRLQESLLYHNFNPRLPIQEHGQLSDDASEQLKEETCNRDILLLEQCQIVVGVLLYDDPGTLLELGYGIGKGTPTLVWDPFNKAKNCILRYLPTVVSDSLDVILTTVFQYTNSFKR